MNVLDGLNPAQKQAVETIEGPLLVLAGPGSGKTRVIAQRVAYLVRVCGVSPHNIIGVTFTNRAAKEMRNRLDNLLGPAAEKLTMGTFHANCAVILRRDGSAMGLDSKFVIYDDDDQIDLIKRSLEELNLDPKKFAPRALLSAISAAKSQLIFPQEYIPGSYFEEVVRRVYDTYQNLLSKSNALDFDDLIMKTVQLFRSHPDVLGKYQSRYVHLLVDEFQDTNLVQYALAKQLAAKYRNICVVGDPDQSIYSWRNADMRNIMNFERDFPDAKVVMLEQNYRSSQTILKAAYEVISANSKRKEKGLWTENDVGAPIVLTETYSGEEEAQFVAHEIERLTNHEDIPFGGCAVMYRTNAQSRAVEEAFLRYGLPYQLVGATRFYARREIKDMLSYLRLIHNPYDSVSLSRIINTPGRGIGQRTIDDFSRWANSQGIPLYTGLEMLTDENTDVPLSPRVTQVLARFSTLLQELIAGREELNIVDLLGLVIERTGYRDYLMDLEDGKDRWDNILELHTVAKEHEHLEPTESLAAFLERTALVSDTDDVNGKKEAVTLITLHQAKGLEFPVVFIVGMEEGILPHFKSLDDPSQLEEERRLCYVGMTRAEKRLYLLRAYRRTLMGGSNANPPSRFLRDIPKDLIKSSTVFENTSVSEKVSTVFEQPTARAASSSITMELEAGDSVRHAIFGEGVVVSCNPIRNDHEVIVDFRTAGTKKLLLSIAPLESIDAS